MKTLVIECSTGTGSLALAEDDRIIERRVFENPRGRGGELFSALKAAVPLHPDLSRILVGTGPGSYNALRSAIGATWGIAKARGIPLHGICSLLGYEPDDYDVIGDARAGQWFFARICSGALLAPPELMLPEEAAALLDRSVPVFSTSPMLECATTRHPDAAILATRATALGPAEPIYLKPPHITTPKK
jgi:tRNA threonylcarbamoyl adenosine modification protein YeaZ